MPVQWAIGSAASNGWTICLNVPAIASSYVEEDLGISINGGSPKWLVYKGKFHLNGWLRGPAILGNLHLNTCGIAVMLSTHFQEIMPEALQCSAGSSAKPVRTVPDSLYILKPKQIREKVACRSLMFFFLDVVSWRLMCVGCSRIWGPFKQI